MDFAATLAPSSAAEAAALLADASAREVPLVIHGNRCTLALDRVAASVTALSTANLTAGLVHYPGDLVVTAPAGMTLRDVNVALAAERQWLPLDPPHAARTTIGGLVAANASGPRRLGYGSPRDLVIGAEVALTDGTVARSGGRVVKNVAGYDLGRLFCGSLGSLGLLTSVTFKLAPVPQTSRTVVARFARPQHAVGFGLELAANPSLTPSAIEVVAPDARLLVRFETTPQSAERMAAAAAALLANGSRDVTVLDAHADAQAWAVHHALESEATGLVSIIGVRPASGGQALDDVERVADGAGVTWSATGRAALGVLRVRTQGDATAQQQFARDLRTAVAALGGHVQFSGETRLLGDGIDPHGPLGTAAAVMFAVKTRFDPAGILPYPWTRR
jgi:glycolate oxidase FAD binding subunit